MVARSSPACGFRRATSWMLSTHSKRPPEEEDDDAWTIARGRAYGRGGRYRDGGERPGAAAAGGAVRRPRRADLRRSRGRLPADAAAVRRGAAAGASGRGPGPAAQGPGRPEEPGHSDRGGVRRSE